MSFEDSVEFHGINTNENIIGAIQKLCFQHLWHGCISESCIQTSVLSGKIIFTTEKVASLK